MTFDREGLQRWYRGAMRDRLAQLRELRVGLGASLPVAIDEARAIAQSLRASGATYGYPELSEVAGLVEAAPDGALFRRVEGLIEAVRRLAGSEEPDAHAVGAEWLELAARGLEEAVECAGFDSVEQAWADVSSRYGIDHDELARRVADLFGLEACATADPSKSAMRLVPEALMRSSQVLPLSEDAERVAVATCDPTALDVEEDLIRMTGRTPHFSVLGPEELRRRITAALSRESASVPRAEPKRPRPAVPSDARTRLGVTEDGEGRVLVVDDDAPWRLVARRVLEKVGYEVYEAGDGQEALDLLSEADGVALIVADLNMPRLDGLELIWALKEQARWADVPVIVVTGETDEVLEAKLMEEGADDYIRKPLDPRLFLARVAATIRRAEH